MFKGIYLWWKDRHFRHLRKKSPEQIFTEIYKQNVWGGEQGSFYSGTGTENPNTAVYIEKVTSFIREHGIRSVLDIGCGNFAIMSKVVSGASVRFTGIDVVDDLIVYNNKTFGNDRTHFRKLDAINDDLPPADLVTIRQVLQHLNNTQILRILTKLSRFKYVLITEHVPITDDAEYNLDKTTGPHIRMRINSGVFIDKPPFSVKNTRILFEYREDDPVKGRLIPAMMRTYIVEN